MKKIKCAIAEMLRAQKKHISFHTPGHKRAGADITELSYSDNLYAPKGVLRRAERDVAEILGADCSFLLTDGSTAGVYAMVLALKKAGCNSLAFPVYAHVCVKHACEALGVAALPIPQKKSAGIPLQPAAEDLETALQTADALLLTSPDYYGNYASLAAARELCDCAGKPLLVDGAHGAHLHFTEAHAGKFADLWVDGVHKSLPALTQGAVVSAKNRAWSELLEKSVLYFRTTSPSYPILASVEYAVKYPRNLKIEEVASALKGALDAYPNDDWSKLLIPFGDRADAAQKFLEAHGVFPEFNDGNYLMFYLSPKTTTKELKRLCALLNKLPRGTVSEDTETAQAAGMRAVWLEAERAIGRVCAEDCGLFPPCMPLIKAGDVVSERAVARLLTASGTYGMRNGAIAVYEEE